MTISFPKARSRARPRVPRVEVEDECPHEGRAGAALSSSRRPSARSVPPRGPRTVDESHRLAQVVRDVEAVVPSLAERGLAAGPAGRAAARRPRWREARRRARPRVADERTRDRHALTLAARQLPGCRAFRAVESHPAQHRRDASARCTCRPFPAGGEAEGEVALDRQVRPEREVLEHDGQRASPRARRAAAVLRVTDSVARAAPALARHGQPEHGPEERRLAGGRRPEKSQRFARGRRGGSTRSRTRSGPVRERDCGRGRCRSRRPPRTRKPTARHHRGGEGHVDEGEGGDERLGPLASSVKIRTVSGSPPGG